MVSPSSPAPQGPRRQVAVIGTLMPHMAAGRHHVYRNVTALALLAALIAAGLGSLPVALVLTAVALPAAVLVYIHDHRLWHDEPLTIIVVAFGLSLLLGIGVGLLETHFIKLVATGSTGYHLPPVARILELGRAGTGGGVCGGGDCSAGGQRALGIPASDGCRGGCVRSVVRRCRWGSAWWFSMARLLMSRRRRGIPRTWRLFL